MIKHNNILVLCTDTPLISAETLKAFISSFLLPRSSIGEGIAGDGPNAIPLELESCAEDELCIV